MIPSSVPDTIAVPPAVRWIVKTLEGAGFETWTVGGAVRDILTGRGAGDWDLATRARPEEVRRTFRRTVPVGIEHGTVGVLARDGTLYEVTTFRKDVETTGRHAVVAFAETLLEDLERRDFTVNAVAWHPLRRELFDPHGGLDDLREGRLRTVGEPAERFSEDYLRVLRALRFAGRFDLEIEPPTWEALQAATRHLHVLSPERIREELWKVLEGDASPVRALELYRRSGALDEVAPELAALATAAGEPTGAWRRTLAVLDRVSPRRSALRLAVLLGHAGDPPPRPDDPPLPEDPGPAPSVPRLRGMTRAAALLSRLRHSNALVAEVSGLVGAGPELPDARVDGRSRRRWLARVGRHRVPDLIRWAVARARARGGMEGVPDAIEGPDERATIEAIRAIRRELTGGAPLSVGELAVSGRDLISLGLRPGPHFGVILDRLLEEVLDDPSLNEPDVLRDRALEIASELADD